MNTHNQEMSPLHWIKLECLPAPFPSDTRILSFVFNLPRCTIRKQAFCNQQVVKSIKLPWDYKVVPWKYQVVLEILRWCWNVKNVVLRHSKMGRGDLWEKERKRWFFSKVPRMQDGQEYLSMKWKLFVIPISSGNIFHHILQLCDNNIPLSADVLKMTLRVMYGQRFIINIVICHKDPHKS